MNEEKLIEQITTLRNDPDKYIEFIENISGQKLLFYQKLILKRWLNKEK